MIPYESALIAKLLRAMSPAALASATVTTFQTWPARKIERANIIQELIVNEQASRRRRA